MFGHIGIVIGLFFNGSTCVLLHTKKNYMDIIYVIHSTKFWNCIHKIKQCIINIRRGNITSPKRNN